MHGSMGGERRPATVGYAARRQAPLAYPTADEDDLTEEELSLREEMVTKLIAVTRDLHASGVVHAAFGRDIPVTLVPHDSHSPFPEWNRQIHSAELYSQFGPYYESIWSEG